MKQSNQIKFVAVASALLFVVWILVGILGNFLLPPFYYEGQDVVFRGSPWGMSLVGTCLVMLLCVSVILGIGHDGVFVSRWQIVGAITVLVVAIVVYIIGIQIATREIRVGREEILYHTLTKQVVVRKDNVVEVQIYPNAVVVLTNEKSVQIPTLFMQSTADVYYGVMTTLGYPTVAVYP